MKANSHCGFRAVTALVYSSEEHWDRVRGDLNNELSHNTLVYHRVFNEIGRVDQVMDILDFYNDVHQRNIGLCVQKWVT